MLERFDDTNPLKIEVCLDFEYIPKSFNLFSVNSYPVKYTDKLTFFLRIYNRESASGRPYVLLPISCSANPLRIHSIENWIYPRSAARNIGSSIFTIEPDSLFRIVEKIYASDEIKAILIKN